VPQVVSKESLQTLLQTRFGLPDFRKGQLDILISILSGRDALAVMPTGGGKSLCYQLPSLFHEGIVVVISPLIALMEDQVRLMTKLGIPAACLHSGQEHKDKQRAFGELKRHEHFILYVSPERVQKPGFAEWVKGQPISLFAVDESHCVSQWGPDFRKDYYKLHLLRELRPDVPILALTATATPQVLKDIVKQLHLREPDRHIHGFYRPNLYYQVESCENDNEKTNLLCQALRQFPEGRVLIYCGTRKQTEYLYTELGSEFAGVGYYHAGLGAEERSRIQKDYGEGRIRVLAATNAFGMGIDHPDVRLVVHYQMPANVEGYYQEMGRAGRDGADSTCLLLYSKRDKGLHAYFIQQSEADKASIDRRWRALETMVQFAEGGECRHAGILTYFKDSFRMKACGHCDTCLPKSPRRVLWPSPSFTPVPIQKKGKGKAKGKGKTPSDVELSSEEEVRAEVLRAWRKAYAEEKDIPAFLVFSNKTLQDLARKNPRTLADLEEIYGIGEHKVEHLGGLILEQLAQCS
jgi:ATP-dependent DNA helicase RecQ